MLTATVVGDIAAEVDGAKSPINFGNSSAITTLIQAVESSTSTTLSSALVSGAAGVIAAANQQVDALTPAANLAYVRGVARVQKVAEGAVSNDLASAAAGQTTIATVSAKDTGSGLSSQVAAATTSPTIIPPANITVAATSASGAAVDFGVSAFDLAGESLTPTLSAASGAAFPIGSTTVTATATDAIGDATLTTFTITVADTTPPTITLPANLVVQANTTGGADVTLPAATATDPVDPKPKVTESLASGFFPLGTTTVTVTATDAAGNVSTGTFNVTVQDTTAPVLTVPSNLVVEANTSGGATAALPPATAVDVADPEPAVTEDQSSGFFALGTTTVHVTATDASGNVSTKSFTVTVQDTTAPNTPAAETRDRGERERRGQRHAPDRHRRRHRGRESEGHRGPFVGLLPAGDHDDRRDGDRRLGEYQQGELHHHGPGHDPAHHQPAGQHGRGGQRQGRGQRHSTDGHRHGRRRPEAEGHRGPVVGLLPPGRDPRPRGGDRCLGERQHRDLHRDGPRYDGSGPHAPRQPRDRGQHHAGADVTLPQATAVDVADPSPVVSEDQSSGFFALGVTTVHVTAVDASGNASTGSFTLTVKDTTPPVLVVPPNLVVQATLQGGGAAVTLPQATAFDVADPSPLIKYSQASGTLPAGTTTVNVTATDASGNVATASFTVSVFNTVPPTITDPASPVVAATSDTGANVRSRRRRRPTWSARP